jgi:hypothetical protein
MRLPQGIWRERGSAEPAHVVPARKAPNHATHRAARPVFQGVRLPDGRRPGCRFTLAEVRDYDITLRHLDAFGRPVFLAAIGRRLTRPPQRDF